MSKTTIKNYRSGQPHDVAAALVEHAGKVFLLKRNVGSLHYAGPAGHVDEGEDFGAALRREVMEEVGLEVTKAELVMDEVISLYPCRYDGETRHHTRMYRVSTKGEIRLNPKEGDDYLWVPKNQLGKYAYDPAYEFRLKKIGYLDE